MRSQWNAVTCLNPWSIKLLTDEQAFLRGSHFGRASHLRTAAGGTVWSGEPSTTSAISVFSGWGQELPRHSGAEGAVWLLIEGEKQQLDRVLEMHEALRGEARLEAEQRENS